MDKISSWPKVISIISEINLNTYDEGRAILFILKRLKWKDDSV